MTTAGSKLSKRGRKNEGRPEGATKRWDNDPDSSVIMIAEMIELLMPAMSKARSIELSVTYHYHPKIETPAAPLDHARRLELSDRAIARLKAGWDLRMFERVPEGKTGPEPGEGHLRSETRRILKKQAKLSADPEFRSWVTWAIMTTVQITFGSEAAALVRSRMQQQMQPA